ncbi:MAG: Neurogenesis glycoprotein [Phormidesmis priestleyi Ana]|uniref:Neurogenesis glycoprotein n=1 Tax=Phormidesmis priestleyi Ana TaxID=1666911 RepID=A0A0P7ZMT2_9CYAN|nr:MAG: Neurogenesis glycoprotein [Phormidesmis priestleyi Ana]
MLMSNSVFSGFTSGSASSSHESATPTLDELTNITVCCEDRWQVYHRLQELDISCQCSSFEPLQVTIKTASEAIQLWSIVKRVSQPQQSLIRDLTVSWQLPCYRANT